MSIRKDIRPLTCMKTRAAELRGLLETAHLLRSPKNAQRLLRALAWARKRKGRPETIAQIRKSVGLDKAR